MVKKLLLIGLAIVFLGFLVRWESTNWLAVNFVDEQDNMVVGRYLTKGDKLYEKIFSHHQPGAYIISAANQIIFKPNTILGLIKQHRQLITVWSIGWLIILGWKFGLKITIPFFIFELIKNIYLGNMFLAESLVVYPIIYLGLSTFTKLIKFDAEIIFIGIIIAMTGLTLAPTWPLLGVITINWMWRWRKNVKNIGLLLTGIALTTVFVATFVDLKGYLSNAILVNAKYYIPIAGGSNMFVSFLKSSLTTIRYLLTSVDNYEILTLKIFCLILLGLLTKLIIKKEYKKVGWILLILSLANLRNFELNKIYYDGFHLLIWAGLLVFIVSSELKQKNYLLLGILLWLSFNSNLNKKTNYQNEFEIYYSRIFNYSEAIRQTKRDQSKLIAIPDEVLGYWQSTIEPEGRFIFFYKWMTSVDVLRKEQEANLNKLPDYLIVKSNENLKIDLNNYQRFSYRGGGESDFYIKKDWYLNFPNEKIVKLKYYGLEAI
ncbi:MAG TPA: hypothetical protein PK639_04065 [Candidatus Woesebacteria bacterium]|nr:hypothetical protein [Candidatus Woesebacteria bacterium]